MEGALKDAWKSMSWFAMRSVLLELLLALGSGNDGVRDDTTHIYVFLISPFFSFCLPLSGCYRGRALLSCTGREGITWYDMMTILLNLTPSITIRTLEVNLNLVYIANVRLIMKWPSLLNIRNIFVIFTCQIQGHHTGN